MDINGEDFGAAAEKREIEQLLSELEQARVTIEDLDQRVEELSAANAKLQESLAAEARRRIQLEQQQVQPVHAPPPEEPDLSEQNQLREQLSTTLEELQVMAEELSLAQDALREATLAR